jgi:phenylacetic acid degradation operon negative regulatory protein
LTPLRCQLTFPVWDALDGRAYEWSYPPSRIHLSRPVSPVHRPRGCGTVARADLLRMATAADALTESSRWFEPRPQDLVITILGAFVHPHERLVWSGGLVSLLEDFGFSTGAARVALARLVRRELLARVRDGRLVHYTVTPRSAALLDEGDRRIFSLGRRPHRAELWTVLWHAIPEEQRLERARLGRRLRFLGFGSVHDAMWISPHDREAEVTALLLSLGVAEYASLLLGRPAQSLDFRAFVARAWDLVELGERYRAFTADFAPFAAERARATLDDREAFLLRTRLIHIFRQFPFADPELPDEVMPAPEHRTEAVALFHALYEDLAVPAQRHFDAVATV